MKYIIRKVDSKKMGVWAGMNYEADKELDTPLKMKRNEILVDKNLSPKDMRQTVAHEKIEAYWMRERGLKYKDAHKIALAMDKNC